MTIKTLVPKKKDLKKDWYFVDAKDKVLGKLATDIAKKLMGKHKVDYVSYMDMSDKVVVTNAAEIRVTGKKTADKIYRRHTGFPGGVKSESLEKLLKRRPTEVLKRAVWGMLPKNKLRKSRITNLYIYEGAEHPHTAWEKK